MSRKYWTAEEESLLRELLEQKKLSFNQMTKFFEGRTGDALRKHAINYMGLSNEGFIFKKHSYNQRFFETPNPINCYVAGFYAADGYIGDNPTTRLLTISLAPEDGHQVETFKRLLEYSGQITIDPREHESRKRCDMHSLRLYSAYQITADLERVFGLTNKKTYRIPAPNITDPHLQLCYLAGLLDGDGCVHINKRGYISLGYTSCSLTIVEWVKQITDKMNLFALRTGKENHIRSLVPTANAYSYVLGGYKAIDLILRIQALKKEGIPILDRKWDNERLNIYIKDYAEKHGPIPITPPPTVTSIPTPSLPPPESVYPIAHSIH